MKHQLGFTLFEALAATALAAIMMVAVVSVVSALARHGNVSNPHATDWRYQLTGVIKRDLQHADQFHSQDNRLTLTGPVSLDAKTLRPTHRPAIVAYHIKKHAGQSWLIRTQTDPDSLALNNTWAQPVCSGVLGLAIIDQPRTSVVTAPAEPQSDEAQAEDQPTLETLPVPVTTATLSLTWADPDLPTSSTTLLIR